eukprot:3748714-Pyramimonas_sp.AAC.1
MSDCQGATVTSIRGVEVPGMMFWHDSDSSRLNSDDDSWRWSLRNGALAQVRISKRLSSNGALPSVSMILCSGL